MPFSRQGAQSVRTFFEPVIIIPPPPPDGTFAVSTASTTAPAVTGQIADFTGTLSNTTANTITNVGIGFYDVTPFTVPSASGSAAPITPPTNLSDPASTYSGLTMTVNQCLSALWVAGFRSLSDLQTGAGIAAAESSRDLQVRNWHPEYGIRPATDVLGVVGPAGAYSGSQQIHSDRGAWQISSHWYPQYTDAMCDNPRTAAKAVFAIQALAGWAQWDTYNSGAAAAAAPSNATVQAFIDAVPLTDFEIAFAANSQSLAAGATVTMVTNGQRWTPSAAGTYTIVAKPGTNGVDSSSNTFTFQTTVTDPVDPGGGSGGGLPADAPTLPANNTVGAVATHWITYGSTGHVNAFGNDYALWKTWGFKGHMATLSNGWLYQFGNGQRMRGSAGDPADSSYNWFRAYDGQAVAGIGAANCGPFVAKRNDPSLRAYIGIYIVDNNHPATGPFGDLFDATLCTQVATNMGNLAAGVKYLGGDGLKFDFEQGTWGPLAGHTEAATLAQYEAFGFQCGTAIYQNFPACHIVHYGWDQGQGAHPAEGSWQWARIGFNNGKGWTGATLTPTSNTTVRMSNEYRGSWLMGVLRAHATQNATGDFTYANSWYYRGQTQVAGVSVPNSLKFQANAMMAAYSQQLSQTVWNQCAPYIQVTPFGWAGTDGTSFYTNSQENQPLWTNNQEIYRQWSMKYRIEYNYGVPGTPGRNATEGGTGLWAGGNNYLTPSGRIAAMVPTASTSPVTSAPPTITNATAVSAAGSTTITCNVSHAWGVWYVDIYDGGTFSAANPTPSFLGRTRMTYDLNGSDPTTGLTTARTQCTFTTPGSGGQWFVIKATSIKSDVAWTAVQTTGNSFRLFAATSLWNTDKSAFTGFKTNADATLSSSTYGINNDAFCHPFFKATSADPSWTVTSTQAGWGRPARQVHIHAPNNIFRASGSDGVMSILDTDGTLWDFYAVQSITPANHTVVTTLLTDTDGVNGTGFGNPNTGLSAGTSAIGIAQASGTILAADVTTGVIPHALFMAFDYSQLASNAIPPSVTSGDAGGGTGPLPEGGLLLAQGSEPSGLNTMEHQLWLACKKYGVYICDRLDGHPQFYGDGSTTVGNALTDAGMSAIGRKLRLYSNF